MTSFQKKSMSVQVWAYLAIPEWIGVEYINIPTSLIPRMSFGNSLA